MQTCRVAFISMFVLAACAGSAGGQASGGTDACPPLETRAPNAPDQRPAFPDQTRACAVQSNVAFDVIVLMKGLEKPWAVEPLPGGDPLVTEKPGRMRIVSAKVELGQPIAGVPAADARGRGGFLDVALSPNFAAGNGSWKDGADVYAKICGYCHDVGVGPVIKGRQLPPEYTGLIVRQGLGAMPAFRSSVIDDQALQSLGEYISKSPAPAAKP